MVINILLLSTIVAAGVIGAPLQNASESQTHSPIIAPDSESIVVGADTHPETHHSDVHLGKVKILNNTELSGITPSAITIDEGAAIHHGDTYMMKGDFTNSEPLIAESTTHKVQETTTIVPQTTEKARGKNENNGAHPVAPVHHSNQHKRGGEGIMKSIVAHSPVASFVETTKVDRSEKLQNNDGSGSVVAHGPMIKHSDNHDKKQGNKEGPVHSTVHHPPMATEHHPPKTVAHHPSLSKNPVSSGHVPIVNHHVVDEKPKIDEPKQGNAGMTTVSVDGDVHPHTSPELHPPTVVDHHLPNEKSLKSEPAPAVIDDALVIPVDKESIIRVEKRSESSPIDVAKEPTPKTIEIHHPLLSKTEGAKTNHEDVKKDEDVSSTTEITGNSLETQHINSGHQLASSHPATISPS